MKFRSLILASALVVGTFVSAAHAETIYSTTVAPGATVTTTSGNQVINQTYTAVGTRKVGMVGSRPYPLQASHVESTSVRVKPETTTIVNGPGVVAAGSSNTSVTTYTTTNGQPVSYSTGGGNYYTENGTRFYANPDLNIAVHSTGSFND